MERGWFLNVTALLFSRRPHWGYIVALMVAADSNSRIFADEAIKAAIGLTSAAIGAIASYLWSRRRASDREVFLFFRSAFDRPAFRGRFGWHSNQSAFRNAISVTLKLVKTGILTNKAGLEMRAIEGSYRGSSTIKNGTRRKALRAVEDHLQRLLFLCNKVLEGGGESSSPELPPEIDIHRDEIIRTLNDVWRTFGIEELRLPTDVDVYAEVYAHNDPE